MLTSLNHEGEVVNQTTERSPLRVPRKAAMALVGGLAIGLCGIVPISASVASGAEAPAAAPTASSSAPTDGLIGQYLFTQRTISGTATR